METGAVRREESVLTTGSNLADVPPTLYVKAILKRTKGESVLVDPTFCGINRKCAKCSLWYWHALLIALYNCAEALWTSLDSLIFLYGYAAATWGSKSRWFCLLSLLVCFDSVQKSWLSFRRSLRYLLSRDSEKPNLSFFCIRDHYALSLIEYN